MSGKHKFTHPLLLAVLDSAYNSHSTSSSSQPSSSSSSSSSSQSFERPSSSSSLSSNSSSSSNSFSSWYASSRLSSPSSSSSSSYSSTRPTSSSSSSLNSYSSSSSSSPSSYSSARLASSSSSSSYFSSSSSSSSSPSYSSARPTSRSSSSYSSSQSSSSNSPPSYSFFQPSSSSSSSSSSSYSPSVSPSLRSPVAVASSYSLYPSFGSVEVDHNQSSLYPSLQPLTLRSREESIAVTPKPLEIKESQKSSRRSEFSQKKREKRSAPSTDILLVVSDDDKPAVGDDDKFHQEFAFEPRIPAFILDAAKGPPIYRSPYFKIPEEDRVGASYLIPCKAGSSEWLSVRGSRVGGSEIGTLCFGYTREVMEMYMSKYTAVRSKASSVSFNNTGPKSDAMKHGILFESRSANYFETTSIRMLPKYCRNTEDCWISNPEEIKAIQNQTFAASPGYRCPLPGNNPHFTYPEDEHRCGVSIDVEGSIIDLEIKNPYTIESFEKNYVKVFNLKYYMQCQWTMAVRNRGKMFFLVTQYDSSSKALLRGTALWIIRFDKVLFNEMYAVARNFLATVYAKEEYSISTVEQLIVPTKEQKEQLRKSCRKSVRDHTQLINKQYF